jgi:hypothetical protein
MKYVATAILAALLYALPASANTVDYSLSVQNMPGIGDFSWEIQHNGFIFDTPATFDDLGNCTNCDRYNFNSFASLSAPSQGGGCGISGVFLDPEYAPQTFFSPLCDGKYDSYLGGAFPAPGTLGTWNWQWDNGDGTQNFETLTITDPPGAVPEPGEWGLLLCGLLGLVGLRNHGHKVPRVP